MNFNENLSKTLFLEINKEKFLNIFGFSISEEIYLPIRASRVTNEVKNKGELDKIPVGYFIEGIFYVLGADKEFKYSNIYKKIANNINNIKYIKGIIYEEVNHESYEDAFILTSGLLEIEKQTEIYDKMFLLLEELYKKNNMFLEEEIKFINDAKNIAGYIIPYYYEAMVFSRKGENLNALNSINHYLDNGGKREIEIIEFKNAIKNTADYEKGKELLNEKPGESLKYLIPLMDEYNDDALLYYYIAIAYRKMENFEKAIYYLNEALLIDSAIVEVVNELGINYASLGNYDTAIEYLRKAFEATRSVEICTNLIMCYLDKGDIKQAKIHLEIANTLNKDDEVVRQLNEILKNK